MDFAGAWRARRCGFDLGWRQHADFDDVVIITMSIFAIQLQMHLQCYKLRIA
jgi:hypothetical protein